MRALSQRVRREPLTVKRSLRALHGNVAVCPLRNDEPEPRGPGHLKKLCTPVPLRTGSNLSKPVDDPNPGAGRGHRSDRGGGARRQPERRWRTPPRLSTWRWQSWSQNAAGPPHRGCSVRTGPEDIGRQTLLQRDRRIDHRNYRSKPPSEGLTSGSPKANHTRSSWERSYHPTHLPRSPCTSMAPPGQVPSHGGQ